MSTSQEDRINILYPSTTEVQTVDEAATPPVTPSSANDRVAALDGEDKEEPTPVHAEAESTPVDMLYKPDPERRTGNPYSLEPESVENTLYGAESKVALSENTDLGVIYSSPEDQAALRDNLGFLAHETGATQEDIHSLVTYANSQLIAGEQANPKETMSTLYEQHGSDLHSKLSDAQALVQSFDALATWLDQTGLGDDPKMINHIIRVAATPRSQARLQLLRKKS